MRSAATARAVEDFRGGYDVLAGAVQEAWADVDQALLYTPGFLRSMLECPGAGAHLAPTIYEGDVPVGFAAGLPRAAVYGGRPLSVVVGSFFSVSPRHRGQGIAADLMSGLIDRARDAGHDATLLFCADGGAMNGVVQRCGVPTARIQSVRFLSRILLPKKGDDAAMEPDEAEAAEALQALSGALPPDIGLRRVWDADQAAWQVGRREGAIAMQLAAGRRRGALSGYIMQVADGGQPKCLFIDDVLWGDLEPAERAELVGLFVAEARRRGARLAVVPQTGYADLEPFVAAHFKPSSRVLHAWLSIWGRGAAPEPNLRSMYMDVF